MNEALFRFLNQTIKCPLLDQALPVFSDRDYVVLPGIAAAGLLIFYGGRRTRVCVAALAVALFVSNIGSEHGLKELFSMLRPYAALEGVNLYRGGQWITYDPAWYPSDPRQSNTFPSSHASNIMAITVALWFLSRRTLWVMAPLALLVGLSRVYTGNHFPGDVLAGYVWGGFCGWGATTLSLRVTRRLWETDKCEESPDTTVTAQACSPEHRAFLWLLGVWTFINFAFIHCGAFDLAGDEAQYWDWSRRLSLGYYSKPPMIAYLIAILTGVGGDKEWTIRSGAVLLSSGALALIYGLTRRIAKNERAALLAALVAVAMPATWAGSVLMTIDPLLVFFWALAMYAFHRALGGEQRMWWVTGLALGLGMLSKYTMLFLYVSFALYLLLMERSWLRRREPYIAVGISLLCLIGVLYWNWANDWVSFRHTVNIGAQGEKTPGKALAHFAEFFAGQVGVVSPVIFLFFIAALWTLYRRRQRDGVFLLLCFGVLFVFYAGVAVTRPPQANWPVCAYLSASVAVGWVFGTETLGGWRRWTLGIALILGCLMGIFARSTQLIYALASPAEPGTRPDRIHVMGVSIDPNRDPTNKLRGARELGMATTARLQYEDRESPPFLFSNRYQLTAWLAFYTKGKPRTYCMSSGRHNQYDMWGGWEDLVGRDGLLVLGGDADKARAGIQELVKAGTFERGEYIETVEVWRGNVLIKTFTLNKLFNYSGRPWTPSAETW